jgi:hypothetical protein
MCLLASTVVLTNILMQIRKFQCIFFLEKACWLDKPEFKEWLARVPRDIFSAACKICRKNFSVASLGVTVVKSHANGKKHKQGELF